MDGCFMVDKKLQYTPRRSGFFIWACYGPSDEYQIKKKTFIYRAAI